MAHVTGSDIAIASIGTPVGEISVGVTEAGLAKVRWSDMRGLADRTPLPAVTAPERTGPVLDALGAYFQGERTRFDVPVDWRFTSSAQQAVLRTLFETVGYGESITYGELAERSGTGLPARAIGTVMGSNPLPIVVPCHRVLAHDGLGGYSGGSAHNGLEVKRWLLTLEGVLPPTLDWDACGLGEDVGDLA